MSSATAWTRSGYNPWVRLCMGFTVSVSLRHSMQCIPWFWGTDCFLKVTLVVYWDFTFTKRMQLAEYFLTQWRFILRNVRLHPSASSRTLSNFQNPSQCLKIAPSPRNFLYAWSTVQLLATSPSLCAYERTQRKSPLVTVGKQTRWKTETKTTS